jgi:uncharacterized protein YutE (UPF0331/DUF86 family)
MVRRDVVAGKVSRAVGWLDSAETTFAQPPTQFASDVRGRDLALFYLFLSVQECIDIAAHWVSDAGWATPDDAGSSFDVLAERAVIDQTSADALRGAVGLRNRIAHGYAMLDYERVHREARSGLPHLRSFLAQVSDAAGL